MLHLKLTKQEALDLLAAVELSAFEHEALEQKLLNLVYDGDPQPSTEVSAA